MEDSTHVVGDGSLILGVEQVVGSLLALLEARGRRLLVRVLVSVVGVGLSAIKKDRSSGCRQRRKGHDDDHTSHATWCCHGALSQ